MHKAVLVHDDTGAAKAQLKIAITKIQPLFRTMAVLLIPHEISHTV